MSWYQPRFQKDPYGDQHKLHYFLKKSETTTEINNKTAAVKSPAKKPPTKKPLGKPSLRKPSKSKQKNSKETKKTCQKNKKNKKEPKVATSTPENLNVPHITKDNFI